MDSLKAIGMNFCQNFVEDVNESFIEECIHLREHLNQEENKKISMNNLALQLDKKKLFNRDLQ